MKILILLLFGAFVFIILKLAKHKNELWEEIYKKWGGNNE